VATKRPGWKLKNTKQWFTLSFLLIWRFLHLPKGVLSKQSQVYLEHWSTHMMWTYISSLGRRSYIDQPCTLPDPPSFEPRVEVEEPYRFTSEDIKKFYSQGFLGPFRAVDEGKANALAKHVLEHMEKPIVIQGFPSVRDRHLDSQPILDLMRSPAIIERLAQLLGPNLLCWRSQVFHKPPGGQPIQWHQASTYMLEDRSWPILEPADRNKLFQLTVWIALTESNAANGCVAFVPGTHRRINTIRHGGKTGFYKAMYEFETDADLEKNVKLSMTPGEFVIFSERVIHGSGPNESQNPRTGINFRIIPDDVHVYRGKTRHFAIHQPDKASPYYDLSKWGVMVFRGTDRNHLNRHYQAPESQEDIGAAAE
jgi:non-heme Fe2+,alpha-ketoglutarate-dependent halogenase